MSDLITITKQLSSAVNALDFADPVTHIYNPLDYAWAPHEQYLQRFGAAPKDVLMLGMNPGPFGMAQVGIPFGEINLVRGWLQINAAVDSPAVEHPKRPVLGFDCQRSEVSGRRVWTWAAEKYGTPEAFFERFYIANYCPLVFMEESGKNRTPDKLPKAEREALFAVCSEALQATVEFLQPKVIIGIGRFAYNQALAVVGDQVECVVAPHPSPANPAANKGWAPLMDAVVDQVVAGLAA